MAPVNDLQVTQLAEAIHRARNDLSTIAAMLRLQAKMSVDKAVSEALHAAELRVMAIARVNAALDHAVHTEPKVDVLQFLTDMAGDLQHAAQGRPVTIETMGGDQVLLPASYARPLGLVANEWVTNALKYAFPGERSGTVTIALHCGAGGCHLTVTDDGVGTEPDLPPRGTGLGTRLVKGLAHQIAGTIASTVPPGGGTSWTLSFKQEPDRPA